MVETPSESVKDWFRESGVPDRNATIHQFHDQPQSDSSGWVGRVGSPRRDAPARPLRWEIPAETGREIFGSPAGPGVSPQSWQRCDEVVVIVPRSPSGRRAEQGSFGARLLSVRGDHDAHGRNRKRQLRPLGRGGRPAPISRGKRVTGSEPSFGAGSRSSDSSGLCTRREFGLNADAILRESETQKSATAHSDMVQRATLRGGSRELLREQPTGQVPRGTLLQEALRGGPQEMHAKRTRWAGTSNFTTNHAGALFGGRQRGGREDRHTR
jgi:hypothetical protein